MPRAARDKPDDTTPPGLARPAAKVCAVIVTYRPWSQVVENVAAIQRQVGRTIVVDNGATTESRALLGPLADCPTVELVFNEENRGVAAALNQGARRAQAGGFEWLATFDQDSRVPEGFVEGLLAGHAGFREREGVAVLSSLYRDRNLNFVYSPSVDLTDEMTADVPISVSATSGNLVRVRAWSEVGGFREDFFIDCVDFEFSLRCRKSGWIVLEVRRVIIDHEQGNYERRRFLWRMARVNDYAAGRRYYQARNRMVMYARFATFDPRWTLRDARGYLCDLLKLLLFSKGRSTKLGATLLGVWHAAIGRRGRFDYDAGEAKS